MPAETWEALLAFSREPANYRTALREATVAHDSFAQARGGPGSLSALPLFVLTAEWWMTDNQTPMKTGSVALREEMASLSSCGRHVIVPDCDHADLPVVRPDAITEAVQQIMEETSHAPAGQRH